MPNCIKWVASSQCMFGTIKQQDPFSNVECHKSQNIEKKKV
jgi:hypothetical protein